MTKCIFPLFLSFFCTTFTAQHVPKMVPLSKSELMTVMCSSIGFMGVLWGAAERWIATNMQPGKEQDSYYHSARLIARSTLLPLLIGGISGLMRVLKKSGPTRPNAMSALLGLTGAAGLIYHDMVKPRTLPNRQKIKEYVVGGIIASGTAAGLAKVLDVLDGR